MTQDLDTLSDALAAESRHLEGLLELLEEERLVLLRGEAASLVAITDRKEAWIRGRAALEKTRRKAFFQVARALHMDPAAATLTDLARREPARADQLVARRDDLRRLSRRLSALVQHNAFLIERGLRYLRGFVASLVTAVGDPATYTASGRSDLPPAALGLIDRRA